MPRKELVGGIRHALYHRHFFAVVGVLLLADLAFLAAVGVQLDAWFIGLAALAVGIAVIGEAKEMKKNE